MSVCDCFVFVVVNTSSAQEEHCFKHVDVFPLQCSCFNITSASMLNKVAASRPPCFTPDSTLNSSVCSLFVITLALILIRVNSVCRMNCAGTFYCAKHSTILFLNTEPKDCIVDVYIMQIYIRHSMFKKCLIMNILSIVYLFG